MQRILNQIYYASRKSASKYNKLSIDFQRRFLIIDAAIASNANIEHGELAKFHTHPNLSYTTTTSSFPLVLNTINDYIVRNAKDQPSEFVYGLPHQGINLKFGELKERVDVAAQNLLDLGFSKGDRIAIALPNTVEFVITFLAASQIGLVTVALNPAYQLKELEFMLKKTGCKGLVIYDSFKTLQHLAIMRKICPELDTCAPGELKSAVLPDLKHIFIINSPLIPKKETYKGTWSFNVISEPKSTHVKHNIPYVEMDDSCLIMFTSGTTGQPKGTVSISKYLVIIKKYIFRSCDDSFKFA